MFLLKKILGSAILAFGLMLLGVGCSMSLAAEQQASPGKESYKMKRLITVEEHYNSAAIDQKIKEIYEQRAKEGKAVTKLVFGHNAPGVKELGPERIAYMDAHGVDAQVISYASAIPATLDPVDIAVELCQAVNNEMVKKASAYPNRFYIFAHLPLGDGNAGAKELERCVKELGCVGAMIMGHYHDLPYDDPHYFPIFAKAQELDVPIYLHPGNVSPIIVEKYYQGAWSKQTTALFSMFGVGWHYDVGMQVVRMMLAGVFDKLPNLKIMLGHWGELVSFYMYRMDEVPMSVTGLKKNMSDYFKQNIYVNPSGMLYGDQFRYCLATFGVDHITWGEDYPYRQKEDIRTFLENFDLPAADKEKIAHGNVEKIMHLK